MENFFYDDQFCSDLGELAQFFDVEETEDLDLLDDDWSVKIQLTDLEPIFSFDADDLCQLLADANEERLSENFFEEEYVIKALKECVDFGKLKEALPKLYYTNGKYEQITKKDLIEWFS